MIGLGVNLWAGTRVMGGQGAPGALLDLRFVNDFYIGGTPAFTRVSVADWLAADGVTLATQAGNNVLRRDGRGALVEATATAHGCNTSLTGLVTGSPGTMPTNWSIRQMPAGLTRTLSTVTIGGVQYLDINFAGTTSAAGQMIQIQFGGAEGGGTAFAVAQNNPLNTSALFQVLLDSAAVTALTLVSWCFTGAAGYVGADSGGGTNIHTTRLTLGRRSHQRSITDATTTQAVGIITSNTFAAGVGVNFTMRIGLPQMTKTPAITSPILTGTGAVTRAAETLTFAVSGISAGADWTIAGVAASGPVAGSTDQQVLFDLMIDGSQNGFRCATYGNLNKLFLESLIAGASNGTAQTASGSVQPNSRFAWAARRQGGIVSVAVNGVIASTAPTGFAVGAPAILTIGSRSAGGGGQWNSFAERAVLFAGAANDATLQSYASLATWGG